MDKKRNLIKFRTDEKIRLEQERHKNIMLQLENQHKQRLTEFTEEKAILELELKRIREEEKSNIQMKESLLIAREIQLNSLAHLFSLCFANHF